MILRAALAWMVMFGVAQAATCENVTYADNAYSICTVPSEGWCGTPRASASRTPRSQPPGRHSVRDPRLNRSGERRVG